MDLLDIVAVLVTLAAVFGYINHRFFRLPTTIGLMIIALLLSLGVLGADQLGLAFPQRLASHVLEGIDFNETVMQGMLSLLLFAGALHVNLQDLAKQGWVIAILASVGVVISTFLIGGLAWIALGFVGLNIPLIYCLLFGALISPTDPIAVLGILKSAGAPKGLETKIAGESLFNDGVGVVVFIALLRIATEGAGAITPGHIVMLFAEEAMGGIVFGLVIGAAAYGMLRSVDNYQIEVLITLALVLGGYALANAVHVSGPIAIVVAGLLIGNHGRHSAMSEKTREHIDTFWELIDEVLNAVLFVLIGLEILVLTFHKEYLMAALLLIPGALLARFISVGIPISLMRLRRPFSPHAVKIMTWGGLRGGISVALALSLPAGEERELILAVTYVIVVFSIIVQGLTIGGLIRKALP